MSAAKGVSAYIETAPADRRPALRALRAAIRRAAPKAEEGLQYGMPFYAFPGEKGVARRLCYFGVKKTGIGFYVRPKDVVGFARLVAPYLRAPSSLHFPADRPLPIALVESMIRRAVRRHEDRRASGRSKLGPTVR